MAVDSNRQPGYCALRRGRRNVEQGRAYLVTTCTDGRQQLFDHWQVGRLVVNEMRRLEKGLGHVRTLAWVVMPDHWYWLLLLPPSGSSMERAELMRIAKGRSAVTINRMLNRSGSVWQPGFHDHAVRDGEDIRAIARYVIAKPVRAGLAADIGGWPLWESAWVIDDLG